jgi:type IV fimbrial biogenesis protein FimT
MKSARRKCHLKHAGYSLVEMMVTLAIGLILVSVALPTMVSAIQSYRLNSTAQQLGNLIELTRYTAIRRNSVVRARTTPDNVTFFIDLDGNGKLDSGEPMVMLPSDMELATSQCTKPDPKTADQGLASIQDFSGQITFDYRGTLNFSGGGSTAAYFLPLAYVKQARYGCRAITVTQMGQTKLWKAPDGGTWTGM